MKIDSILIENIRSHVKTYIKFSEGFNCLVGGLGAGKSSILAMAALSSRSIAPKNLITTCLGLPLLELEHPKRMIVTPYNNGKIAKPNQLFFPSIGFTSLL